MTASVKNKWWVVGASIAAIASSIYFFSGKAADSVIFFSKTKETNIAVQDLKVKVDSLKSQMKELKQDTKDGFKAIMTTINTRAAIDSAISSERERLRNEEDNKYRNSVYKVAKSCIIK